MNPPAPSPATVCFTTRSGLRVTRTAAPRAYPGATQDLPRRLDAERGLLLASSFEYPGRYTRWDIGFVNPPLEVAAWGRRMRVRALNERGAVLLPAIAAGLAGIADVAELSRPAPADLEIRIREPAEALHEEQRSRRPTVFSVLRALVRAFAAEPGPGAPPDPYLGLYGAFGYELAFQFDPIRLRLERDPAQRDLVLYLPDEILTVDHRRTEAMVYRYDFARGDADTRALPRRGERSGYRPARAAPRACDHEPGAYAAVVRLARERFRRGELFEAVPGQTFYEACPAPPSAVFERLKQRNPAPYGALVNLGESEYLVAASPEMYVRVDGRRIETCPISGTIARGRDAIEDAQQILALLGSEKEASELTMCTDVDRNDKSRVCEPGSVRVIGRRQIEMYSRLIHTVDHVEGRLRPGFDALDGFLAHAWAVTVTGAPKHAAIQFIEDHERSPRRWYGGAIGAVGFDGNMNTGLTLRTVRIKDGVAEVRAGATLLYDSDPEAEEAETRLKAAALLDAIRRPDPPAASPGAGPAPGEAGAGTGRRVLMVDHHDSFVHTLAAYLRETGAEVATLRSGFSAATLAAEDPDLVVLSPGPGRPADFGLERTIAMALERGLPLFGVCLGLQGIVEYFGGRLGTLGYPVHGKPSAVVHDARGLFEDLPTPFTAGRYHSLFADPATLPPVLAPTARTAADGVIMAVEHRTLPVAAVQFHPESILSLGEAVGRRLIHNVVRRLRARDPGGALERAS